MSFTDRTQNHRLYSLPPKVMPCDERAGPVFFATHRATDLRNWPSDRLRQLGPIVFPLAYSPHDDRYEVKVWGEILGHVARAIDECEVVTLAGNDLASCELERLQALFHHHAGKMVELMQCSGESCPGHVGSYTNEAQAESAATGKRVVIALGGMPSGRDLGLFEQSTTLFIHEHLVPAMFEISGPTFVVPLSRGGWKLSHIAFHRLLDIETEMLAANCYKRMFEEADNFSRPLCLVLAELLSMVRGKRGLHHLDQDTVEIPGV